MRKCRMKHVCIWNVGYRAQNRVGCRGQRGKVRWQLLNLCVLQWGGCSTHREGEGSCSLGAQMQLLSC